MLVHRMRLAGARHALPGSLALPRLDARQAARERHNKTGTVCSGLFQQPAYNKYREPHEIEKSFWDGVNKMGVLTEEEQQRPVTVWSFLAALPVLLYFRVLPFQVRFVCYILWFYANQAAYRIRKLAVLQGAKLDVALLRWRGDTHATIDKATVLRRLHGKDALLDTARFRIGILLGKTLPPAVVA